MNALLKNLGLAKWEMESDPSESNCSKSERLSEKRVFDYLNCENLEEPECSDEKRLKSEKNHDALCDQKVNEEKSVTTETTFKPINKKIKDGKLSSGKGKSTVSKKKLKPSVKDEKSVDGLKNGGHSKEKPKSNMRRNIRDILKDDELEAETRAAQQRELERIQRLQQQKQQLETNFSADFDISDETNETSALVENLHALAKELEDSTLSPQAPIPLIDEAQDILTVKSETSGSSVKVKVL